MKQNKTQKIALERIYRLFELAETIEEIKYKKRYISLAQTIGKKTKVKIPQKLKEIYCKKCLGMNIEKRKEKPFLIIKCKDCGFEKKFGLEKNK